MKFIQGLADKSAIGLSALCMIHCLLLPLLLILVPSLAVLGLDDESFHLWMVIAVVPTSFYALTLGCKQHKRYRFLSTGFTGLAFLVCAVVFGESMLGEVWEKFFTVIEGRPSSWKNSPKLA